MKTLEIPSRTEYKFRKLPGVRSYLKDEDKKKFGEKDGTPIEKGAVITETKLLNSEDDLKRKMTHYTVYPDLYIDDITPAESGFKLLFSQRVFIRTIMRCKATHITAARGFSKSFIGILAFFLKCIFQPGSHIAIAAPSKKQAAEIGTQKIQEIMTRFPLLKKEIIGEGTWGKDYARVKFRNGSILEVTAALESTRGRRFSALMLDEVRDMDGEDVNSILIPTLVISRRTLAGILNPYEPHQAILYATSASSKSSYNYEKVLETYISSIIEPHKFAVIGIDYRIPVMEGLMGADLINQQRASTTVSEAAFAREYLSIYTSENDDSWFNFDQLLRHRKMVNAEWSAKRIDPEKQYYLISCDVGRFNDQTEVFVFKVSQRPDGKLRSQIVNIYTLGKTAKDKQFSVQTLHLKKIIKAFNPREVVIDTNGNGVGIADELIRTQVDFDGEEYGPIGFLNDDHYSKIQPKDAPKIAYSFKASSSINSEMYGIIYSRINAGLVDFCIKEQDARGKLLSTKKGQKMGLEERTRLLMPYEATTKLFEQMGNLRLKRTGSGTDITLERINTRFPKDKFSALGMGLYVIKGHEDRNAKRNKRLSGDSTRKMVFYTGAGGR